MTTEDRCYEIHDEFASATRALQEVGGDRLICDIDEDSAGRLDVTVSTKPPGATQWTTYGPTAQVLLTRAPSGEVGLHVRMGDERSAATDVQAAAVLGVDVRTWTESRGALEAGMTTVAASGPASSLSVATGEDQQAGSRRSARPALLPPVVSQVRPEDNVTFAPGRGAAQPGMQL
jgi:hypothetical protein